MSFIKEIEEKLIYPLLDNTAKTPRKRVSMEWKDGTNVVAMFDTAGETQNEFDEDEEDFEEYFMCVMKTVEIVSIGSAPIADFQIGELFEVNYHNFPDFIKDSDGKLIIDKEKILSK